LVLVQRGPGGDIMDQQEIQCNRMQVTRVRINRYSMKATVYAMD
jgi:hypothetical protein